MALPLVVEGEDGRLWFAGAGRRPTTTMVAMGKKRGSEGERGLVREMHWKEVVPTKMRERDSGMD